MNRQPSELDPRVAAWLDEGPITGPEQVLSNAFAQARSVRQDRAWLHRRSTLTRFQTMTATITLAAVAVLAFGVGVGIAPRGPDVAAPAPSASPAATPAPSESPAATPAPLSQMRGAGTYTVTPFVGADWAPCGPSEETCFEAEVDDDLRFTFTVPDGWTAAPLGSDVWLAAEHNSGPAGAGFLIGRGGWLYSDPCTGGDSDLGIGPGVDEFVYALTENYALTDDSVLEVSEPVEITLAGFPGQYLEIRGPADLSDCPTFAAWGPTFHAQGANDRQPIWVVDVDGVRVVIHGSEYPGTAPERSAELRAIVESMRIEHDPELARSMAERVRGWPGSNPCCNPAGFYSWTPGHGGRDNWMHKYGEGSSELQITIQELDQTNVPVKDLGMLGFYVPGPYGTTPESLGDVRAWIMDVDGSRIVILMQSSPDAPPAAIAEGEAVIDSIRVEPTESDAGYRLVFELEGGWDNG